MKGDAVREKNSHVTKLTKDLTWPQPFGQPSVEPSGIKRALRVLKKLRRRKSSPAETGESISFVVLDGMLESMRRYMLPFGNRKWKRH